MAGVLAWHTTPDTPHHALATLTEAYDPAHRFGFRRVQDQVASDEPGLLLGAAGIALVLADYGEVPAPPVNTEWNAALLLNRPDGIEYPPVAHVSGLKSR